MNSSKTKDRHQYIKMIARVDGEEGYERWRKLYNSRFDYRPSGIVFPSSAEDVAGLVRMCRTNAIDFRVRSGGHHHEGMSVADDLLIIDLSDVGGIELIDGDGDEELAWIGAGCKLGDVYQELWCEHGRRTIPGGVCNSVGVAGLAQGGGWGLYARKFGLACDALRRVEIVTADGQILMVDAEHHPDLFWALRGGGGGNFGIVTRLLFKTEQISACQHGQIRMPNDELRRFVPRYLNLLSALDPNLTTFAQLLVRGAGAPDAITIKWRYIGERVDEAAALEPIYRLCSELYPDLYPDLGSFDACSESVAPHEFACQLTNKNDEFEKSCEKSPAPHKVSSAFPRSTDDYDALGERIADYISKSEEDHDVTAYLGIHGIGGAMRDIESSETAFAYRDKDFIMQFQAWWSPHDDRVDWIDWIERFRHTLGPYVEGAFINFPDVQLSDKKDSLMALYYAENYQRLREIKAKYDPTNLFMFDMSVPPARRPMRLPDMD